MSATSWADQDVSVYLHIPFCSKKCPYCHFFVLPDKASLKAAFFAALKKEWQLRLPQLQGKRVVSIYLGGGTPSLLTLEELDQILQLFTSCELSDPEVTLEINPENLTTSLAFGLKDLGVNRASLGLQSLQNYELIALGRTHHAERSLQALELLKEAGITNVSIDLMYDVPHQTEESFLNTLSQLHHLPITHLSLYNLTLEPHTPFFKHKKEIEPHLPSATVSTKLLHHAVSCLEAIGLKRYEISAFAKEGYYARHNTGYWIGRPFLGLGPSAFSYWKGRRFQNVAHLGKYVAALNEGRDPVGFEETLSCEASQRELLAIHLRLIQGVDLAVFQKHHGRLSPELMKTLRTLEQKGWVQFEKEEIRLTELGLLFYDSVAVDII